MINKILKVIKMKRAERSEFLLKKLNQLPFKYKKSNGKYLFLNYQPASYVDFNKHQEFEGLYKKFIKQNHENNSGDIIRLWSLILNIKQILEENIEGDFAELGVWRGNTAAILAYYAKNFGRKVILYDTFEGFDKKDLTGVDADIRMSFSNTSIEVAKDVIGECANVCEFNKGYFPSTIQDHHRQSRFSLVSLDCDLYEPMKEGLKFFYPLMSKGGIFFLHDYSSNCWPGAKLAIDEFCRESEENLILIADLAGSAFFRKTKG